MKYLIILFLFSISCISKGQDIALRKQYYYCLDNNSNKLDTICDFIYTIENKSCKSIVIMFTEDDVDKTPTDKLILRKCCRKYNDFQLSSFAWEPNMSYSSEYSLIPELFVKVIKPCERFDIIIHSKNEYKNIIDAFVRSHLMLSTEDQVEKIINGFFHGLNYFNAEYPYSSIIIDWSILKNSM